MTHNLSDAVGAALFYTSTLQPYTFHNLRQYILHRLLTTSSKSYPFKLKAQVVERDAVLVPSGWDSWGKLRVLRDGFDCDAVHQGWDADMDAVTDRQQPGSHGARGNYEDLIHNPNSDDQVSFFYFVKKRNSFFFYVIRSKKKTDHLF